MTVPSAKRGSVKRALLPVLLLVALLSVTAREVSAQAGATVVYVVRHAERAEDGTNDPPISEVGWVRARLIARIFEDAGLTKLHTTDFKRTRSTLAPVSDATGLEPAVYDPSDLPGFAARLRSSPGRHLVSGHSNTNTALVEALGGDPGGPIGEMEYDRAYVVVILPDGSTGSATFRFGAR
jgi:broad specificity phosphatase PhoE